MVLRASNVPVNRRDVGPGLYKAYYLVIDIVSHTVIIFLMLFISQQILASPQILFGSKPDINQWKFNSLIMVSWQERTWIYGEWENNSKDGTLVFGAPICSTESKLPRWSHTAAHTLYFIFMKKSKQTDTVDALRENKLGGLPQIVTPFLPKFHLIYICFNNFIFMEVKH